MLDCSDQTCHAGAARFDTLGHNRRIATGFFHVKSKRDYFLGNIFIVKTSKYCPCNHHNNKCTHYTRPYENLVLLALSALIAALALLPLGCTP